MAPTKPRALDLFCGAGGATKGLQRAGFHVTGVDINPQPRYCGDLFVQGDALAISTEGYDFVWASPPCQSYSAAMKHLATPKPKLIEPLRGMFKNLPAWVIENVVGAPLINPLMLCGSEFGLRVHRHRLFESPLLVGRKAFCAPQLLILNPHRSTSRERMCKEFGKQDPEKIWAKEMGVAWMNRQEARESIPPAYSEFIGRQVLAHLALASEVAQEFGPASESPRR